MTVLVSGMLVDPGAVPRFAGSADHGCLLVHPATLECIQLDDVGRVMWEALRRTGDEQQSAQIVADRFSTDPSLVRRDLAAFIDGLRSVGLVVDALAPAIDDAPDQAAGRSDDLGRGAAPGVTSVTTIIACHDRRELTVRCVRSLFAAVPRGCRLAVVLVDDGSSDGTTQAVTALDLPISVISGDGEWYWSRSMAEAERVAEGSDPDVILWLNDDVDLDPSAVPRMLHSLHEYPDHILVGAMWSERASGTTFSGFDWRTRSALMRLRRVDPTTGHRPIEGFHGNFVAVPRSARRRIGPIDGAWLHQGADLDYALRAADAGVPIVLMPGYLGTCDPVGASWFDPTTSVRQRARDVFGRKAWPLRTQVRFHRRHAHGIWPVHLARYYVRVISGIEARRPRPASGMRLGGMTGSDGDAIAVLTPMVRHRAVDDLVTLGSGPRRDMTVSRAAVLAADEIVSGAVGGAWDVQAALWHLHPVPSTVYDPAVGRSHWFVAPVRAIGRLGHGPIHQPLDRVRPLWDEIVRSMRLARFALRRAVRHQRSWLGEGRRAGATSMADALTRTAGDQLFVVLDIAGAEIDCLSALLDARGRISGLVMVVHRADDIVGRIADFAEQFDTHVLVSLRDHGPLSMERDSEAGRVLEIGWVRRDLGVVWRQ